MPYIGDSSDKVRNSINSCLKKIKCGRVELKFLSSFSRLSDMFKFKDKQPKALASNVVYQITCDCGFRYIGETCRNLLVRFNEHIRTSGPNLSEVAKHILCNKTCQVNFDNCKVLCYENDKYLRKLKESLFIQQFDDGSLLNGDLQSVPLYIFNLPSRSDQARGRIYPDI